MASKFEIYHAMAGAGKTTKLMELVRKEVRENNTGLSKIAFVSFTKQAATVAQERLRQSGLMIREESMRYFQTLHSMCFKANHTAINSMMNAKKWQDFARVSDFKVGSVGSQSLLNGVDWEHLKDMHIALMEQVYRNNREYAMMVMDHNANPVAMDRLAKYMMVYSQFRKTHHYLDFTDLLQLYIDEDRRQDVEVAFIDEAQDLTPLQWQVAFRAFRNCRTIYIAGDPNQCIYRFTGADPEVLINMEGNLHYLDQSYRVPAQIMDIASKILKQVKHKVEMDWHALRDDGKVKDIYSMEEIYEIDESKTYFFLARTHALLKEFQVWCELNAYPYYDGNRDNPVFTDEMKQEFRKKETAHWDPYMLDYARRCNAKGRFYPDPVIRISTMHGVKGDEADVVIVKTDMSRSAHQALEYDADSEHRLFFVAVTRARKELYIMHPQTKMYYPYIV